MSNIKPINFSDSSTHQEKVEKLLSNIRQFLAVEPEDDSEWNKVQKADLETLEDAFHDLARLKFGADYKGVIPVKIITYAKAKEYLPHDYPIRFTSDLATEQKMEDTLLSNIRTCSNAVKAYGDQLYQQQFALSEFLKEKRCRASQRQYIVQEYENDGSWVGGESFERDRPSSIHKTVEEARAFVPPPGLKAYKTKPMFATPSTESNPDLGFKEYFDHIEAHLNRIVPYAGFVLKQSFNHGR